MLLQEKIKNSQVNRWWSGGETPLEQGMSRFMHHRESCAHSREAMDEALTAVRVGRVLSTEHSMVRSVESSSFRRLFVTAQYQGACWRVQIKPHPIPAFRFTVGIFRNLEGPRSMGLQALRAPDPRDAVRGDAHFVSHGIRDPVATLWRRLSDHFDQGR